LEELNTVNDADPSSRQAASVPSFTATPADMSSNRNEASTQIANEDHRPIGCQGISELTINNTHYNTKEALFGGFWHAYRNALRVKASYRSNHRGEWRFDHKIHGVLIDPRNETDDPFYIEDYSWLCRELDGDRIIWQHKKCSKTTDSGQTSCKDCWNRRHKLFKLFSNEVDYCLDGVPERMSTTLLRYKSPTIIKHIIQEQIYQLNIKSTQIYSKDKKIDKLLTKLFKVEAEVNWDELFDPNKLKALYTDLCNKEEVADKEVMDYLFRECIAVWTNTKTGTRKGAYLFGSTD